MSTTAEMIITGEDVGEYADERAVFRIDDGERHWYVAVNAVEALTAHVSLMEPDDFAAFAIAKLAAESVVTLYLESPDAAKVYPAEWERIAPTEEHDPSMRVRATAGQWAAFTKAGEQICSTCFP